LQALGSGAIELDNFASMLLAGKCFVNWSGIHGIHNNVVDWNLRDVSLCFFAVKRTYDLLLFFNETLDTAIAECVPTSCEDKWSVHIIELVRADSTLVGFHRY